MLIVKDKEQHERAKKLRWFGIDRDVKAKKNWQAWEKREMTFDIEEAGYKFQPTDVSACFGLVGLKYADKVVKHRQMILDEYKKHLKCPVIGGGSAWLCGIYVSDRDKIADALKDVGVETNLVHLRNDIFKIFGGKRLLLKNMNRLEDKYLYLPIHHLVTKKDVKRISTIVNGLL
jgi:dTDP-4-amino-4,6-dideoxygalactose transaminase